MSGVRKVSLCPRCEIHNKVKSREMCYRCMRATNTRNRYKKHRPSAKLNILDFITFNYDENVYSLCQELGLFYHIGKYFVKELVEEKKLKWVKTKVKGNYVKVLRIRDD